MYSHPQLNAILYLHWKQKRINIEQFKFYTYLFPQIPNKKKL